MGIKFSGHTMGTPNLDIYEAMELFKELGYDGIEVRVHANGQINSETISDAEVLNIKKKSEEIGIEFSCLTPYYQDFTSDKRDGMIANLKRVIEIANILSCPLIRLYGGTDRAPEGVWFVDHWTQTVSGIREVAEYASKLNVSICIETHAGSLTMSVRDTIRIIEDVNMNNVGMLFDYAWVELAGVEEGKEAVRAASRYITHCHIKDWKLESKVPLKKESCLMGKGTIAWKEVLMELRETGYQGYISDEYEKLWYPDDLPEPEIGMKHNLAWIKNILK
jgi:sugar phosphate isomerase/epimerase